MEQSLTLGYWLSYARQMYGEDSPAVKYLLEKIQSQGETEIVIADVGQTIQLLHHLDSQKGA